MVSRLPPWVRAALPLAPWASLRAVSGTVGPGFGAAVPGLAGFGLLALLAFGLCAGGFEALVSSSPPEDARTTTSTIAAMASSARSRGSRDLRRGSAARRGLGFGSDPAAFTVAVSGWAAA